MSAGGRRGTENFPSEWSRLERATEDATNGLTRWVRRAREAEEEVERLRKALEEVGGRASTDDAESEVRRLRAENAALQSRMLLAKKRVTSLLQRLAALEIEP